MGNGDLPHAAVLLEGRTPVDKDGLPDGVDTGTPVERATTDDICVADPVMGVRVGTDADAEFDNVKEVTTDADEGMFEGSPIDVEAPPRPGILIGKQVENNGLLKSYRCQQGGSGK